MKTIVFAVAISVCFQLFSQAFVPMTNVVRRTTSITMGGGRSQGEMVLTKRQIFQEVRGKLNEAAQIPGFFDVGQHVVSHFLKINKLTTTINLASFVAKLMVSLSFLRFLLL